MAQVKGNQKFLFQEVQRIATEQAPLDCFEAHEKGHGRESSWYVFVYDAQHSAMTHQWKNLRRVIHVHRIQKRKKEITHADAFYISDKFQTQALFYHKGIRGHWGIENSLHYVKDVVHGEDKNRIRTGTGPIAASIFSSVAINIHRKNGYQSITEAQIHARKNIREIICQFRT